MITKQESSPVNTKSLSHAHERVSLTEQTQGAERAAFVLVPHLLELFPEVGSVVYVGRHGEVWLHQFRLHGAPRIVGLDYTDYTDEPIQTAKTEILRRDLSKPFTFGEKFDLAISLGEAERLPSESAERFITNLTSLSDVIVFSAAIPGQGGTINVNERWPSYWAALFKKQGFVCLDILRGSFWYDERIEWRYKQNMLLFVKDDRNDLIAEIKANHENCKTPLDLVHPRCFELCRSAALNTQPGQAGSMFPGTATIGHLAEPQLFALRARLLAIEQSTSWRAISYLQRIVAPYPGLRRFLRRAVKLSWWTLTLKLPGKILERTRARVKKR